MGYDSPLITKAKDIISSVRGAVLSIDERKQKAIELAAIMLEESKRIQTSKEKKVQGQLARLMNDPIGKVFTTSMTDQCFRSSRSARAANQLNYIIKQFGIPKYLSKDKQMQLKLFSFFGRVFPFILVPLAKRMLRRETSQVILPGEPHLLKEHMDRRKKEGVRINLNHLGEAILGEEEALHRLNIYLIDLAKPEVEYISVKISTICSQLHLLAWEQTLSILSDRLSSLYRAAQQNLYTLADGKNVPKFVNLDMEEYRDLQLTVSLFCRVLEEPEFFHHSAGIVLQSYLPDAYLFQQELTAWALQRIARGGAPIKIRIVKGANLAMEQVEASLRGWPQAPYTKKIDVDANYKRMVTFGCLPERAQAVHLGIASHNLFDIAYALILRSENNVEPFTTFEMLEGMADHMRRVVQALSGDMLLYCPAAARDEFQNAVAYLVRRLDENTAPENFLRHAFGLSIDTPDWDKQASLFSEACQNVNSVSFKPRRTQNRFDHPVQSAYDHPFANEPDTDWSLTQNRKWAEGIIKEWSQRHHHNIPIVIGGENISVNNGLAEGIDPSHPGKVLYYYNLAQSAHVNKALQTAKNTEMQWQQSPIEERSKLLWAIAQGLRSRRADLIGAMLADTGKTIPEADIEVSEAIDFAEYYRRCLEEISTMQDIQWKAKGTVLIAPPWNFPCSIPAGGILAALAAGNCVIFKPASEAVLVGWTLVQIFWEAGISKEVLQFLTCRDDPIGSLLVQDPRLNGMVLTGATATAKYLLKMRPGIDLIAETGGKNTIIVTSMSDRDLAIKDIVQSAFGHAGQKCSACSLAICEKEVYDDMHFRKQLRDAAASLIVGSPWDPATSVNPLIQPPNPTLRRGLTSLEPGEEWLLQPKQDSNNPLLWSPGIKQGVTTKSFTYQNELFGPVLGIMRAESLQHAVTLANGTPYGLTAGIHSLDNREQRYWLEHIEAGNCYINRTITGAIVQRQPFGGYKDSCFGPGAKAGGPNYVMQLMEPTQITLPKEKESINNDMSLLHAYIKSKKWSEERQELWNSSIGSYTYFWEHYFRHDHDPSCVLGQDNIFKYVPHERIILRIDADDQDIDVLRVIAAAVTCSTLIDVSSDEKTLSSLGLRQLPKILTNIRLVEEDEKQLIHRLKENKKIRLRLLKKPNDRLQKAIADIACNYSFMKVLANGRLELLHYLREVSISNNYHRYGNLGAREKMMSDE